MTYNVLSFTYQELENYWDIYIVSWGVNQKSPVMKPWIVNNLGPIGNILLSKADLKKSKCGDSISFQVVMHLNI